MRSRARSVAARLLALGAAAVLVSGCADFSSAAPPYSPAPSLTPPVATPVVPLPEETRRSPPQLTPSSPPSGVPQSPQPSGSSAPSDPCRPPDPAVIAACLNAPWGLVPLADGLSALVGERTTGRILLVAYEKSPVVVTTVPGIEPSGDGGLLGLAVSPSYAEDGLIYAYLTTKSDNRIVRVAKGDAAKPIFTGIPKGAKNNGGPIAFDGRELYVATGDTGKPALAADPSSLAGKVLRLDEFGKPARSNPTPKSPIFASGLTRPTGFCALPTGVMGVVDDRAAADLLLGVARGAQLATAGKPIWTWKPADGGGADCAWGAGVLANTSLDKQKLTGVQMSPQGGFTGQPNQLLDNRYGRLRTVETGTADLLWVTTSNKDGKGKPTASDDRVIVVPSGGGGGGGSID